MIDAHPGARQHFLVELGDTLLQTADARQVMGAAVAGLGRHLGAQRVGYGEVQADDATVVLGSCYADGVAPLEGAFPLDSFGAEMIAHQRRGRTQSCDDVERDPTQDPTVWSAIDTRAFASVPLVRGGRFVASLYVNFFEPHRWTGDELALVEEVAARTWAAVERARAEAALRESEERLRLATENAEIGFWDVDVVQDVLIWPPRVKAMFGISSDVPVTMQDFYDGLHPEDRQATAEAFALATDPVRRGLYDVEYRTIGKEDGVVRWVAAKGRGLFDDAGHCVRVAGTAIDISGRKKAEDALQGSEEFNRRILQASADCIKVLDLDGRLEFMSEGGMCVMEVDDFGAIEGKCWPDFWSGEGQVKVLAAIEEARRGGTGRFQGFATTMKGSPRWWDVLVTPINGADGRPERLLSVSRDVSAAKAAERAVRESRDRLEEESHALEVLNQTGVQVAAELNLESLVQTVVDAGVKLTGARFGAFFYNVFEEGGARYMLYALSGAKRSDFESFGMPRPTSVFAPTFRGEGIIRSDDILVDPRYGKNTPHSGMPKGHLPVRSYLAVPVMSRSGEVIGGLLFGHDEPGVFTERSERVMIGLAAQAAIGIDNARLFDAAQRANAELEERVQARTAELEQAHEALRQAQKMEAVGQLTGGIAHDFNNMLAVVIGSLDLLGRRMGTADARSKRYVDAAADGARRAALLTQRLLAFSRQQPLKPEPVDTNKLVAGMSELIRGSLGSDIRLETVLASGLWRTHADPNQLENVLLNLAVNARDAMPEGGRLTIETQNAHLDARYVAAHLGVPAGQYVMIAVTDTGSGMPPEVIAKAFDPFFTTKQVGKGTGLGLSQVYGFVKQTGGHVKIYSEAGQGTTIKVYLPRLIGAAAETNADELSTELPNGDAYEVVLVVEDEPAVRQFSVDALTELGYRVIESDGAETALRLLDSHPEIVLIFTDIVMPDVNGARLAEEARRRRPDLKVLFTTGYTRNAVVHNGVLDAGVELISKPFTIEELAAKVREVLDAPAPALTA